MVFRVEAGTAGVAAQRPADGASDGGAGDAEVEKLKNEVKK